MQQSTKISEYLKTVCEQIRWKKAHSVVSEEIHDHIIDQKHALEAEGIEEDTAIVKAIEEMGDPVLVGSELDRIHRPKIEWSIIVLTGMALLLGVAIRMFVFNDFAAPLILKSIIITLLGTGFMITAYFLDFTVVGKHSKAIFLGLVIVTIAVMLVSPIVNGRYLYVPFILLLFPTAFAGIVYSMRGRGYMGIKCFRKIGIHICGINHNNAGCALCCI